MTRWLMPAAAMMAASLLTAGPAGAQVRSVAEELRVNAHAHVISLGGADGGDAVGYGGSLGYGGSRWFMPFLTLDLADIEYDEAGPAGDERGTFRMRHLDAGVRVHVRGIEARLVPFAVLALTWRAAYYEERFFMGEVANVKISGIGPTFGAGVLYYIRPRFALEVSGKWTGSDMETITVDGLHFNNDEHTMSGSSQRLNVGLSLFPTGRTPGGR